MSTLKLQSTDLPPEGSKYSLAEMKRRLGYILDCYDRSANSSILPNGYMALNYQFERSALSADGVMKTMANYLDHIFPIPIDKDYSDGCLQAIREEHE